MRMTAEAPLRAGYSACSACRPISRAGDDLEPVTVIPVARPAVLNLPALIDQGTPGGDRSVRHSQIRHKFQVVRASRCGAGTGKVFCFNGSWAGSGRKRNGNDRKRAADRCGCGRRQQHGRNRRAGGFRNAPTDQQYAKQEKTPGSHPNTRQHELIEIKIIRGTNRNN